MRSMRDSNFRPATLMLALLLHGSDLERRAAPLDLEPFARELRQALALELGEAAFEAHLLHRGVGGLRDRRLPMSFFRALELL